MKCPICGSEMKPLLISEYCENDCDRIVDSYVPPEITERIVISSIDGIRWNDDADAEEAFDGWAKALDDWYDSRSNTDD